MVLVGWSVLNRWAAPKMRPFIDTCATDVHLHRYALIDCCQGSEPVGDRGAVLPEIVALQQ